MHEGGEGYTRSGGDRDLQHTMEEGSRRNCRSCFPAHSSAIPLVSLVSLHPQRSDRKLEDALS